MTRLLVALLLVLPVALLGSDPEQVALAKLKNVTRTSAVAQADRGLLAEVFLITDPVGSFSFAKVSKIRKITRITFTLTLEHANTGPGDFDENDLSLALDGIDTVLKLNGFLDEQKVTKTINRVPLKKAALRAALKADGKLAASIIDADPGDNGIFGSSTDTMTLVIKSKQKKG